MQSLGDGDPTNRDPLMCIPGCFLCDTPYYIPRSENSNCYLFFYMSTELQKLNKTPSVMEAELHVVRSKQLISMESSRSGMRMAHPSRMSSAAKLVNMTCGHFQSPGCNPPISPYYYTVTPTIILALCKNSALSLTMKWDSSDVMETNFPL